MKSRPTERLIIHSVSIETTERWSIYHRLLELDIPCACSTNKPLQVQLDNPSAIAQLCSVVRHTTASRSELIHHLNCCWQIKSERRKVDVE